MDVLLTGDLSTLTGEICRQLSGCRVTLAAEKLQNTKRIKRAATFSLSSLDPLFAKLFDSNSFGAAVYLQTRGEQEGRAGLRLEELDRFLHLCGAHRVPLVLYVTSSEACAGNPAAPEGAEPVPLDSLGMMLAAGEALCRFHRQSRGLNVAVLRVPYLYGPSVGDCLLARLTRQARKNRSIALPGERTAPVDFLRDSDLAALIAKMIDEGYNRTEGVLNLGSGKPMTFEELALLFRQETPSLRVRFLSADVLPPPVLSGTAARRLYDWVAAGFSRKQLGEATATYAELDHQKPGALSALASKFRSSSLPVRLIELAAGFALMQALNAWTQTSAQFRLVDFRLLYVILLGSMHGKGAGLAAGALACVSCALSYAAIGLDWKMLLYNVDNWFPFAAYLVAGAATGFLRDKSVNSLHFERERFESLEQRYVFLYELYDSAVANKSRYKDQIMSYRDSFGRIFAVTKKLDHVLPDEIYRQAVEVLEDVLENKSVALYSVGERARYARLEIASDTLENALEASIELALYAPLLHGLKEGEVWSNREALAGYPSFCAPIYDQGRLAMLVMVYDARFDQMTTYYANLVKVLCGLIAASLARAAAYNAAIAEKLYLPGTRILRAGRFREVLAARLRIREENKAAFSLLRVEGRHRDLPLLSDTLSRVIRGGDVIGQTDEGHIYVLLAQARGDSADAVCARLENAGVRAGVERAVETVLREFTGDEPRQAAQQ